MKHFFVNRSKTATSSIHPNTAIKLVIICFICLTFSGLAFVLSSAEAKTKTKKSEAARTDETQQSQDSAVTTCTPNTGAPTATDDMMFFNENTNYFSAPGVLGNDFDGDGGVIAYNSLVTPTPVGSLVIDTDGDGSYTTTSTVAFQDMSGYRITDNQSAQLCTSAFATAMIYINFVPGNTGEDNGVISCPMRRGKPVNVTNGNMYLQQTDYSLPGVGPGIELVRTFNSSKQTQGIFSTGWTTIYDERLELYSQTDSRGTGAFIGRIVKSDGKSVYMGRKSLSGIFTSLSQDFHGELTVNSGPTYTLTYKDGEAHQFNSSGRLTSITDRNGNQTALTYDGSNRLSTVTDVFSRSITFDYSVSNHITVSDSLGEVATYVIDPSGSVPVLASVNYPDGSEYNFTYAIVPFAGEDRALLTEVTDALGNTLEKHEYDGNLRASTSEGDDAKDKYTFVYDSATQTTVTDGNGNETVFTLKQIGTRKVVEEVEGDCGCGSGAASQSWEYDDKLNITKFTDGNGHEKDFTYDADGDVLTKTDDTGTVTYTYNSYGQILTKTDQMSGVITLTYDGNGNVTDLVDVMGYVREFEYNGNGQMTEYKNTLNKITEFAWSGGNLESITDALSNIKDFYYDARSRLTTTRDALHQDLSFEYDERNRVVRVIFADSNYIEYTYDNGGRRTSVRDPRGKITEFDYDANSRLTAITDPLSHIKTFAYDDMSNLISATDANSNTTSYEYDDLDRLKKITYPAPSPSATPLDVEMTYDDEGNIETRTDTAGRVTGYEYDDVDRLVKIIDPFTNETEFEYNDRSQLTKVTDALNQEYDFTYDALGRQMTQTRNGTTMSYTYNREGKRVSRTDHNGGVTTYTYDDISRLTDVAYSGSANYATYAYDDIGQMTSAVNQNGTVTFTHDNRGRVTASTDVHGKTVEYTYDENGNRLTLALDSTPHTSYEYDDASRLIHLTDETNSGVFDFDYDDADRLIGKTLPNGVESTFTYDNMDRLTRLKHEYSSTPLFDNEYSYNTASQISQIAGLSSTRAFSYDDLDRLTDVSISSSTVESYTYDDVGNRTASHLAASHTYDPFNRLTETYQMWTYWYDDNGNEEHKAEYDDPMDGPDPTIHRLSFTYDEENRLIEHYNNIGSPKSATYQYDALGRRIQRDGVKTVNFTYDGPDVIMDDNSSGPDVIYQNGPGIDNKLKLNDGADQYFLQDHLGSTAALTDSGGTATDNNTYDSFGNPSNSGFPTRYQYTGREYDGDTDLYYYRARQYDPKVGRFTSEDPVGFDSGDINMYGYVWNNPMAFTDARGLTGDQDLKADKDKYRHWDGSSAYDRGFQREYFQCGPSPYSLMAYNPLYFIHPVYFNYRMVPDRVGGPGGNNGAMFGFKPACFTHDECYMVCKDHNAEHKKMCDDNFLTDMRKSCDEGGSENDPYREKCRKTADRYHSVVSDQNLILGGFGLGASAYKESQDYCCKK